MVTRLEMIGRAALVIGYAITGVAYLVLLVGAFTAHHGSRQPQAAYYSVQVETVESAETLVIKTGAFLSAKPTELCPADSVRENFRTLCDYLKGNSARLEGSEIRITYGKGWPVGIIEDLAAWAVQAEWPQYRFTKWTPRHI